MQDGKIDSHIGRIVIYDEVGYEPIAMKSNGSSRDHNDLITSLAARYRIKRSDVASYGYRYYWRATRGKSIVVSPVRKIDYEFAINKTKTFDKAITAAWFY